jgi:hypothetical protein
MHDGRSFRKRVIKGSGASLQWDEVENFISHGLSISLSSVWLFYVDADNEESVLCEATMEDFVATARMDGNLCMKLKLDAIRREPEGCFATRRSHQGVEMCNDFEDWEKHSEASFEFVPQSGRCFLKNTVLLTPNGELKDVDRLSVGDRIRSVDGQDLDVAYARTHPIERRSLVTVRTKQTEITVTSDHRVITYSPQTGRRVEKFAQDLIVGDIVYCGSFQQRITKLVNHEERAALVEIRFNPDEAVETLMVASHGIHTKGAPMPGACRAMGALGPWPFETRQVGTSAKQRSRSL